MLSPYERTKNWFKVAFSVILIGVGLLIFRACDKKRIKEITKEELKNGEQTAVIIDSNGQVTALTRKSTQPVKNGTKKGTKRDFISVVKGSDGARGTRISIDENGNVRIKERIFGFLFEPGFGAYTSTCYSRGFIVDSEILFYKRHGVNAGLLFNMIESKEIRPEVSYSYLLPFKYTTNSSVLIGVTLDKDIFLGVRTKF